MDVKELTETVDSLRRNREFEKAEELLVRVHSEARQNKQTELALSALQEMTLLYTEQGRFGDVEACHRQAEELDRSAWSLLSSAWFYLYTKEEMSAAASKAAEAIAKARLTQDTSALYTSLSARGQALIRLDRLEEVEPVLSEMLDMVKNRRKLVPGDELILLEMAQAKGIALRTVAEILTIVQPYFEEPAFIQRGNELAKRLAPQRERPKYPG